MEQAVDAYTDEHIASYTREVRENGLREHGYPRLTANIGILLAPLSGLGTLGTLLPGNADRACADVGGRKRFFRERGHFLPAGSGKGRAV